MFSVDEIEVVTDLITTGNHVINREFFLNKLQEFKIQLKLELLSELKEHDHTNHNPIKKTHSCKRKCRHIQQDPRHFESYLDVDTTHYIIDQSITTGTIWALQSIYRCKTGICYIKKSTILFWHGHKNKRRLCVKKIPHRKGTPEYNRILFLVRIAFESQGINFIEEKEIKYQPKRF